MKKAIGWILLGIGVLALGAVVYLNSPYAGITRPFSTNSILTPSWEKYKQQFLLPEGRVVDPSQQDVTTSEGQAYAMLRAVWIDDKPTFDSVWQWTSQHMRRSKDQLFGWKWGKRADSSYGFLAGGGDNSAADADSDIGLALILASRRWNNQSYEQAAWPLVGDIWRLETATAASKRYLIAGNWAQNNQELVVNPSYFAPYAWRIFAQIDRQDNWNGLIGPAYDLLAKAGQDPLGGSQAVGLPPDWLAIERTQGALRAVSQPGLTTNYSFDAMRIPWRIALDWQWNHDPRAKDYLTSSFSWLGQQYQQQGKLGSVYAHDGTVADQTESPSMYATALGYFMVAQPHLAETIYQQKIIQLYSNATNTFDKNLPYYDQNWLWFGVGLYNQALIPFTGGS